MPQLREGGQNSHKWQGAYGTWKSLNDVFYSTKFGKRLEFAQKHAKSEIVKTEEKTWNCTNVMVQIKKN